MIVIDNNRRLQDNVQQKLKWPHQRLSPQPDTLGCHAIQMNNYFLFSTQMSSEYVPLLNHSNYEIMNEYPFTIHCISDGYEPTESTSNTGRYQRVNLYGKSYLKH